MVIRRIRPLSCAKVSGILYAGLGLIFGAFFSLFFFAIGSGMGMSDEMGGALISTIFGAAAIVVMPVLYGVMGFVIGGLTAVLYNLAAGVVGGINIEVDNAVAQ